MSSINTNMAAMNALSALRNINMNMTETQGRISTGYKVSSGKDNAAYFQISTTMRSESSMLATINESMALAKGSMSTARLGAETLVDLAQQFTERLAFASQPGVDQAAVGSELQALAEQMITTINQSSFNGENLIGTGTADKTVTTGISRAGGTLAVTSQTFTMVDLQALVGDPTAGTGGDGDLSAIAVSVSTSTFTTDIGTSLVAADGFLRLHHGTGNGARRGGKGHRDAADLHQ
jgi:flagellin